MPIETGKKRRPRTHSQIRRIETCQTDQANKDQGIDRELTRQCRCKFRSYLAIQLLDMTKAGKKINQSTQPKRHTDQMDPISKHRQEGSGLSRRVTRQSHREQQGEIRGKATPVSQRRYVSAINPNRKHG